MPRYRCESSIAILAWRDNKKDHRKCFAVVSGGKKVILISKWSTGSWMDGHISHKKSLDSKYSLIKKRLVVGTLHAEVPFKNKQVSWIIFNSFFVNYITT